MSARAWAPQVFDLRAHVRQATLPAPGGDGELHEWLGDFWSHRRDRARPLREMVLVDGLADGGWMLATKTHHALVDGVGSIDVGHILLDAEPHPAATHRPRLSRTGAPGSAAPLLPDWLLPGVASRVAGAAVGAALHPRRMLRAGEAAVAMGEVLWKDEVTASRRSTLNVPIGTTRTYASVRFTLAEIKEVRLGLGGTVKSPGPDGAAPAPTPLVVLGGEHALRPIA